MDQYWQAPVFRRDRRKRTRLRGPKAENYIILALSMLSIEAPENIAPQSNKAHSRHAHAPEGPPAYSMNAHRTYSIRQAGGRVSEGKHVNLRLFSKLSCEIREGRYTPVRLVFLKP